MKYFIIVVMSSILLLGCHKYKPEGSETKYDTEDFIDLHRLTDLVYVDTKTDVLYYWCNSISPIMKADGTCLTLTEWKAMKGLER